ncbi:hypothetical protein [Mesorhizobium sp.]|nr:hypothetical protein [Mesorhizobium sp.]
MKPTAVPMKTLFAVAPEATRELARMDVNRRGVSAPIDTIRH